MGTTDDWYGATRGLAPGEVCNLVYASDFDANEIELLRLAKEKDVEEVKQISQNFHFQSLFPFLNKIIK